MFSSQDNMLPYALRPSMMDRRRKPGVEVAPNCPRCDSSNTKFCYYNNYSLTQPRYFCKGCRRYWTKGGSLRNVPYGGGCRKNRRGKSLRISSSLAAGTRDPPQARRTPLSSLRPDLALDDMVGNSCQFHGSNSISSLDVSSSEGSNIDLAVLYAKFLNQCPVIDPVIAMPQLPVEMDQPFGFIAGASDLNYQMPIQLSDQHSVGDQCPLEPIPGAMLDTVSHSSVGELDFSFEPCGFDSLASPVQGVSGDNLSSSCLIVPSLAWQEPKYEGFGSVDDNDMVAHQNPPINGWTTLDQSRYIALPSNMYRS